MDMTILYVGNTPEPYLKCSKEKKISLITAANSLEALELLKTKNDIKVVISNYTLPGNNGMFFYDKINELYTSLNIPFILISNEFNKDLFERAFIKGISDYFVASSTSVKQIISKANSLYSFKVKSAKKYKIHKLKSDYKIPKSKRIFDVFFASLALLLLSPLLITVMLAIRIESKGKVYYIAKRVGRKTFDFYKFRSMKKGSDMLLKKLSKEKNQYSLEKIENSLNIDSKCPKCSYLSLGQTCSPSLHEGVDKICDYWHNYQKLQTQKNSSTFIKIVDDPRITRIGKIIRNTSIDELPQLINVIKGDMSIVGNRPLPVYEAELLTKDIMSKRFLAPAGITGLWQVELRGKGGIMSEKERMQLDNKYADYFTGRNYSFWFDIKILLRTIPALFQKSTV